MTSDDVTHGGRGTSSAACCPLTSPPPSPPRPPLPSAPVAVAEAAASAAARGNRTWYLFNSAVTLLTCGFKHVEECIAVCLCPRRNVKDWETDPMCIYLLLYFITLDG